MAGSASRDLVVNLIGKTDGLRQAFSGAGMLGGLGKAGLFGAIAAATVGAGVGIFRLGEDFDGAYDTIRTATGATGRALEDLTGSFDSVLASGPSSFDDVATAISQVHQRLNLTGSPLEGLAGQFLDLSRITGTDLSGNIESVTRLFGDWGVAGDDMAGTMDEVFRASQASGVGVDQLADGMVRFGAPLRQLGFGFEESLAIFGKFEAEGVNTNLVLGSMRVALGRLAKDGEPVQETFTRLVDGIKNAGSTSEANAMAVELFGARAGPDMAAAIREGRFEIDDYLATIEGGSDTIQSATDDTDDWRESWETLKNKTFVALKPLATGFFDAIGNAMKVVEERGLGGAIVRGLQNIGSAVVDGMGELVSVGARFGNWILDGLQNFWDDTLLPWIQDLPGNIVDGVGNVLTTLRAKGRALLSGLRNGLVSFWEDSALPWLKALPGNVVDGVGNVLTTLRAKGRALLGGLRNGLQSFWTDTARPWLVALPGRVVEAVGDVARRLWFKGWQLIGGLRDGIVDRFELLKTWVTGLPGRLVTAVGEVGMKLYLKGWNLIGGLRDGLVDRFNLLKDWVAGIPGRIWASISGAIPGMLDSLRGLGERIAAPIVSGFQAAIRGLIAAYNAIPILPNIPTGGGGSSNPRASGGGGGGSMGGVGGLPGGGGGTLRDFHSGGFVPGGSSDEMLAILQGGEFVVSHAMQRNGIGGDIYVTINMPPGSNGDDVLRKLREVQRRRGPLPLAVR